MRRRQMSALKTQKEKESNAQKSSYVSAPCSAVASNSRIAQKKSRNKKK